MKEYYDKIKQQGYEGTISFEICDRRYYCDPDKAIDAIVIWMQENIGSFIKKHYEIYRNLYQNNKKMMHKFYKE